MDKPDGLLAAKTTLAGGTFLLMITRLLLRETHIGSLNNILVPESTHFPRTDDYVGPCNPFVDLFLKTTPSPRKGYMVSCTVLLTMVPIYLNLPSQSKF